MRQLSNGLSVAAALGLETTTLQVDIKVKPRWQPIYNAIKKHIGEVICMKTNELKDIYIFYISTWLFSIFQMVINQITDKSYSQQQTLNDSSDIEWHFFKPKNNKAHS